jgi:hypothetical protein
MVDCTELSTKYIQAADIALPDVLAEVGIVAELPPICGLETLDSVPSAPPQPIAISDAIAVENEFETQVVDEAPAFPAGTASGERVPEISSATQAIFVAEAGAVQDIELTPPAMFNES